MKIGFSIVLPTYQCSRIENAVNSVLHQTYTNWELLIIDNNQNNTVRDLVKKFDDIRIRYYKIWNNGVIAKSRNLGIKKSKFSWISFLDSDDVWTIDKLEEVEKVIKRKNCNVIYHNMYRTNGSNFFFKYKLNNYKHFNLENKFEDLIVNGNDLIQSSVVVKKKIINHVNLYSENKKMIAWEDFDLWLRIAKKTNNFYLINKCLGNYFIHSNKKLILQRYVNNIKEFKSKYYLEINAIKRKYKINNLDWVDIAEGLNLFKKKKYLQSYKKLRRVKKKDIKTLIRVIFLNILNILDNIRIK